MKHSNLYFHHTTNNIIDSLESDMCTIINCIDWSLDQWQAWSDRNFSQLQQVILATLMLLSYVIGYMIPIAIYSAKWAAVVLFLTNIACVPNTFAPTGAIALLPEATETLVHVVVPSTLSLIRSEKIHTMNTYGRMTRNQLRKIAQERKIPRYSRMLKTELISALAS